MNDREAGMAPTSVQLVVGPVHYAIALRPEDPAQLRAAIDLACRWWGGISFPWLTLDSEGAITGGTQRLCSVLDVAGIIDLTRSDNRDPIPAGLQALGVPITAGDLRPRWAMPLRGVLATETGDPLITAASGEGDDVAQMVAIGTLGPDERDSWANVGQSVSLAGDGESVPAQLTGRTAATATAAGIETVNAEGVFPSTAALVWVLPDSFTLPDGAGELAAFWNFRALRLWHLRTVTVLARQASLREPETRRKLVEAVTATAFSTPMCVFNGVALGNDELRVTAEDLGFKVIEHGTWSERHTWHPDPLELTAVIDSNMTGFWMTERHSGTGRDSLAVAHRPRWKARIDSPRTWRYPEASQGLVSARISSPVITGPRTDAVAALYQQNSRWLSGGVRIFTHALRAYHLDIGLPDPAEVLAAALASRQRGFRISDKGREIDGILAACDDLALFRKPAFHALTAALTPQPSPRVEKALDRIAEQIAQDPDLASAAGELRDVTARARAKPQTLLDLASHTAVKAQGLSRPEVSSVLTEMLAHGLIRWGYERTCKLCGLVDLVPLSEATAVPQCAGCGREAAYASRENEPVLHYALGSLLQRVSRNSGLVPLAAAAALHQQGYYVIPGAAITGGSGPPDTDLLAWNGYHLLAGEAKAAASLFDPDKLPLEIGAAADMGATMFLITCPDEPDDELLAPALTTAYERDIQLMQLTGKALTSGLPITCAVLQAVPEAECLPESGPSATTESSPAQTAP
jgi:hypothetical protein